MNRMSRALQAAFCASLLLETSRFGRTSAAYGAALLTEAAVLGGFVALDATPYLVEVCAGPKIGDDFIVPGISSFDTISSPSSARLG